MSPYSDNLDNEQKPSRKKLLPQGERIFTILSGKEATSKSGNSMFVFHIQDLETQYEEDIYCVSVPGKRWLLKTILSSCGIERQPDGNYNWDIPDLLNKKIVGMVEHEPNEFINRQGETIKTTQHKITDFIKYEPSGYATENPGGVKNPEDIAWEE